MTKDIIIMIISWLSGYIFQNCFFWSSGERQYLKKKLCKYQHVKQKNWIKSKFGAILLERRFILLLTLKAHIWNWRFSLEYKVERENHGCFSYFQTDLNRIIFWWYDLNTRCRNVTEKPQYFLCLSFDKLCWNVENAF